MTRIAALLLAAGASSRMRGEDKLTTKIEGEPLLRRSARTALDSQAEKLAVVFGAQMAARKAALEGLDYAAIENPQWSDGLGSSISCGMGTLSDCDGVLVLLADMPGVTAEIIDRLIQCFIQNHDPQTIVAPRSEEGRGNPVLFGSGHFAALKALTGDTGAGRLLEDSLNLHLIEAEGDAIRRDLDTPEDWTAYRGKTGH